MLRPRHKTATVSDAARSESSTAWRLWWRRRGSYPGLSISMHTQPGMEPPRNDFWKLTGRLDTYRIKCLEAVQRSYRGYRVKAFKYQGYCSLTLILSPRPKDKRSCDGGPKSTILAVLAEEKQLIVQVRPAQYALDLDNALTARMTYPRLAPVVRAIDICLPGGLQAYEMNMLEGTPCSRLALHGLPTGADIQDKQQTLITSFADVIAQSWPVSDCRKRRDSVLWPESSANEEATFLSLCTGKVGSRMVQKLDKLSDELPDQWLRKRARATLEKLCAIHNYPVVLNHGDLIPSNILISEETWEITGLVDWAEAEWLPFGICFYGLEHLLGSLRAPSVGLGRATFVYCDNASQLREHFWTTLLGLVPELRGRKAELEVIRDVGVFLWHGFAWDEGAIDRVVDEVNDIEELTRLRAFLKA